MIYAIILLALVDGFIDFSGQPPVAPIVFADVVTPKTEWQDWRRLEAGYPDVTPAAEAAAKKRSDAIRYNRAADEAACADGSCRAPARRQIDALQPSESVSGPTRRFQPLRFLFRGRR